MKDPVIQVIVDSMQESIIKINELITDLHSKDVEIKLAFDESKKDKAPCLYIWKAIEHIDYTKVKDK